MDVLYAGCDFSSSPSRRKPIVFATGRMQRGQVHLAQLEAIESLDGFSDWLCQDRAWIGAFDFPFGLPRELVTTLGWPLDWHACMQHYASLSREQIRATFAAFCNARPVGGKFAHRATDLPAGSSSSMKWVNPPVAYMLHAGVPRLLAAGVQTPALGHRVLESGNAPARIALEGYPGLLARELLMLTERSSTKSPGKSADKSAEGTRRVRSYKNDAKALQTPERLIARKDMLTALENGQSRLGIRLKMTHAQRDRLVDDATGDSLDAVLCLMQAAWAGQQHEAGQPRYGLPEGVDPLEGWIITS